MKKPILLLAFAALLGLGAPAAQAQVGEGAIAVQPIKAAAKKGKAAKSAKGAKKSAAKKGKKAGKSKSVSASKVAKAKASHRSAKLH